MTAIGWVLSFAICAAASDFEKWIDSVSAEIDAASLLIAEELQELDKGRRGLLQQDQSLPKEVEKLFKERRERLNGLIKAAAEQALYQFSSVKTAKTGQMKKAAGIIHGRFTGELKEELEQEDLQGHVKRAIMKRVAGKMFSWSKSPRGKISPHPNPEFTSRYLSVTMEASQFKKNVDGVLEAARLKSLVHNCNNNIKD